MLSGRIRYDLYSTESFAPSDRHEAWQNRMWPSLAPLYATLPQVPFDTSSMTAHFGGLSLAYVDMTGQSWRRDAAMVRSRPHDALGVNFCLIGRARGIMGARSFEQPAGAAILLDFAQESLHESTGGRTIQLVIPRGMATDAGLDVAELHGLVLQSPAVRMLTSHILRIREALPDLASEDGPRLARSVLDLVVVALSAGGRAEAKATEALTATALARAQMEIRRNLGSPALTVTNLSRSLGISRSTLHRLFEEEGGVQAYVRNHRLDAVRRALRDPGNQDRIGVLADRYGFSDAAHLSRLFRERFRETPSECRMEATVK